jgi:hypothetical protein
MSRVARSPWLLVFFVALLLGAPIVYTSCARTNTALASLSPATPSIAAPSSTEVLDAMYLAGLDPKALCAVGVSAQSIAAFVAEFRDDYLLHGSELTQAEAAIATAQVSSDALRRKIQSGKGSPEDVTNYQTAMASLTAAEAARTTALAACRAGAEATLSQAQRDQLARIRSNKSWELPMEFLLVDRTEAQWVALRDALANEKIAPRYGQQTAPEHASVLSSARSNADVAQAKTRLDSNLAATQSAFNAALVE